MSEVIKQVPGHPRYWASSLGFVISDKKEWITGNNVKRSLPARKISSKVANNGYTMVWIDRKNRLLHRIIAMTHCPGFAEDLEVNHKDGNKQNNCADNLEWVTPSQNAKHAYATGLHGTPAGAWKKGIPAHNRKFFKQDVQELIRMKSVGFSIAAISRLFGIHTSTLFNIFSRNPVNNV